MFSYFDLIWLGLIYVSFLYLENDGDDISVQYLPHLQNHHHHRIYIPHAVITRTSYCYTFFHPYSEQYFRLRRFAILEQHPDHYVSVIRVTLQSEEFFGDAASFGNVVLDFRPPEDSDCWSVESVSPGLMLVSVCIVLCYYCIFFIDFIGSYRNGINHLMIGRCVIPRMVGVF